MSALFLPIICLDVNRLRRCRQRASTFQRAFEEYVEQLPPKHRVFVEECKGAGSRVHHWQDSPKSINEYIAEMEKGRSQQISQGTIFRIINPVVGVLKDLNEVISNMG